MGNNLLSAPTGKNEWYTPMRYFHMARFVMGSIDCDPASSDKAQKFVNAKQYFTLENDGLLQEWKGNVWLNPPYSFPAIEKFSLKLLQEIDNENTKQAIMLTNASVDTKWFHSLLLYSSYICLKKGRIAFFDSTGKTAGKSAHGSVFFYFGKNGHKFKNIFSHEGIIMLPEIMQIGLMTTTAS